MLDKYRALLEENSSNEAKFYEFLAEVLPYIDTSESELEGQKSTGRRIKPKEWTSLINILNIKLSTFLEEAEKSSNQLNPEYSGKVNMILDFCTKYFQATRRRTHPMFITAVVDLLKFDDWGLIIKALTIMKEYTTRNRKRGKNCAAIQKKEIAQWLLNIALGQNLKNSKKMSFLEMLREPIKEVVFQYFSTGQEEAVEGFSPLSKKGSESSPAASTNKNDGVPAIRTIRLSHLAGNTTQSQILARELSKKCCLPKELFPALWCKVRIAKTGIDKEESKYCSVLASLLAYNVLCKYRSIIR